MNVLVVHWIFVCQISRNNFHFLLSYHSSGTHTVCPRSSDSFYISSYHIKRVATSWTNSMFPPSEQGTHSSLGLLLLCFSMAVWKIDIYTPGCPAPLWYWPGSEIVALHLLHLLHDWGRHVGESLIMDTGLLCTYVKILAYACTVVFIKSWARASLPWRMWVAIIHVCIGQGATQVAM